jgi:phage protein U
VMTSPMALGPFFFHSERFGYRTLGRDLSTRWAELQTVGGLNQIQWTGGDDDVVYIEGVIFPEEFGGLAMLEGLRAAAKAGMVLPLVTLSGDVRDCLYVIEGIAEDQSYHDARGIPRKDVYRIRLRHYPGGKMSAFSIVQSLFG